jgi:hypothetical protein
MTEAILISELAVGLPVFTLCPLVAIHFGEASAGENSIKKTMMEYFRSPIFIAVVAGLAVAQLHLPFNRPVVQPVLQAAGMINGTMAALACLILGLQIEVRSFKKILPVVAISAFLQMAFQPLLAHLFGGLFRLGSLERQVLVLIACMPSAVLGPVFAVRYKCEGELAATVTFINIILGAVGIPLAFWLLGR